MTDLLKQAEAIHDAYRTRTRAASLPFQDAVVALLVLIVRLMIDKKPTKK